MKKIFIEAHKMTRRIKAEYPEVNYQVQFGLCLSFLFEEEKEEKEMKVNFKGTERQVKFAEDIFEKTIGRVLEELEIAIAETEFREESTREKAYARLEETKEKLQLDAGDFISKWKWYLDESYIRIINDAQDWLDETTGVRVSGRAWMTLQEKNYEEI